MERTQKPKRFIYLIVAVIIGLIFIEIFLRFIDIGAAGPFFEKRVNTSGAEEWVTSGWAKKEGFADNRFEVNKRPGKVRVFILGGSAAKGIHWDPRGTPAKWLEWLANRMDSAQRFEVVNLGFVGADITNVQTITENLDAYAPDVLLIYAGDNEFLPEKPWFVLSKLPGAHSRFGGLRIVTIVERIVGLGRGWLILRENRYVQNDDGQWLHGAKKLSAETVEQRASHFRNCLAEIIRNARLKNIKVIVATVPSNLRDWAPNSSGMRNQLSVEERLYWIGKVEEGKKLLKTDIAAAKSIFNELVRRDPIVAEAHYWLGIANLYEKNFEDARKAFLDARDLDDSPTRILSPINRAIREAAGDQVYIADAEKLFAEQADAGIPGFDLFDDACHPNLKGQYLLAVAMRDALFRTTGLENSSHGVTFNSGEFEQGKARIEITPEYSFGKLTFIGLFLGLRSQRPRTERAIAVFEEASKTLKGYKYVLAAAGLLSLSVNNQADAESFFQDAFSEGPERVATFSREYFPDNLMWQSPIFVADARKLESVAMLQLGMMSRGKSSGGAVIPPLESIAWGPKTRIYALYPQVGKPVDITDQVIERIHRGLKPLPELESSGK